MRRTSSLIRKNTDSWWLKTYPSMEPELYKYLLRRAVEEGLPPCGHMTKILDYKSLIDAGYSCCEHTSSLPREKEDIAYAAQHGMWFCPTHVVCKTLPRLRLERKTADRGGAF